MKEKGLEATGLYYGSYRGIVGKNNDPENIGRLQVICPQVYGDSIFEEWAYPKGIFAGKGIGSFFIPNEGDMIWVSFEGGDPRFPIWEYGWWQKGAVMDSASPSIKILQTTSGHKIIMDDENRKIDIEDSYKNVVRLDTFGISIIRADNKKISLGKLHGSDEPAVLGDKAMSLLIEFMDDIGKLGTITTSTGVTGTINTAVNWTPFATKWQQKWDEFKSKNVTLDK